jgi:hypothetical protein
VQIAIAWRHNRSWYFRLKAGNSPLYRQGVPMAVTLGSSGGAFSPSCWQLAWASPGVLILPPRIQPARRPLVSHEGGCIPIGHLTFSRLQRAGLWRNMKFIARALFERRY